MQIRILSDANGNWMNDRVVQKPKDSNLEYARFGLDLSQIRDQQWLEPVSGVRGMDGEAFWDECR